MTTRSVLIIAFLGLASAGIAAFSLCHEMLYLSAQQDVAAYAADNWSYQDPPDAVVNAGSNALVTGCVSDKSDVHLVVEVSGHKYFVGPGEYVLFRHRAGLSEAWLNPQASFSCKGFLQGISRQAPNNSFKPKPLRGSA